MTHIMVDLETLSTRSNARILAIGAVKFTPERGVYDRFYRAIFTPSIAVVEKFNDVGGFHVSKSTLDWWRDQSIEARAVFADPDSMFIDGALMSFTNWVSEDTPKRDAIMWGNGASFDNSILSTAYALCGLEQPWEFWNNSCYRTLKNAFPEVSFERIGVHHNAVDDAESQARHLLRIMERMEKAKRLLAIEEATKGE